MSPSISISPLWALHLTGVVCVTAHPRAGIDYPRSVGELQAWFSTDACCLDYLEWLRWPGGFICPVCAHAAGWRLGDGRLMCAGCGFRTSVTAGTIFDRTRTPLTVWFTACWLFVTVLHGNGDEPWVKLACLPKGNEVQVLFGDIKEAIHSVEN